MVGTIAAQNNMDDRYCTQKYEQNNEQKKIKLKIE